jgi:tRNA pseudouridine13 synthase
MGRSGRAVSGTAWEPPAAERELGIGFYGTRAPGVDGQLKTTADAFRVTEISSYPLPDPDGAYVVLRLVSRDWEQHELATAVARRLALPPHAVHWSGTKDRRAVAERLFSYRGPLPEADLGLRDVELLEAYRARDGLVLGHHYGNAFDLRVAGLAAPPEAAMAAYRAVDAELRSAGGFPNFFGPQRFGEVRPITHEVGRWIVRGDLARAVEVYLADVPGAGGAGRGDEARRAYAEHHDAARALREFPAEYRFERVLLDHLARGHTAERALRALSRDLRTLFVHAYQAWIFNRWLSARHAAGLPFDRPLDGDRIVRVARDGTVRGPDSVPVDGDNVAECSELVRRGRAWVAGPLVGYETGPPRGEPGALLAVLLASEAISPDHFRLPASPDIASRGAWRPVRVAGPPIGIDAETDDLRFRFALPKGSYATVLLREFLKHDAVQATGERAPPA